MYDKKLTGALIQAKRLELRLTQEMLAEKVGCSVRHIVNVERGAVGLSIESMLALCEVFHTTPNDLLFPQASEGMEEVRWLVESLKRMTPEQRHTATAIISPYVETTLSGGAPLPT